MKDLGTLGGKSSSALAINDNGIIVGLADTTSGESHAFVYENNKMYDLGNCGETSFARDINFSGKILGNSNGKYVIWSK